MERSIKQKRKKVIRYDENPFIKEMIIQKKERKIKVSCLGKDDNILVNQKTGEVRGTHVTSFRTVDETKFVKLFVQNITLTFDLTSAGVKALNVLIWEVQKDALCKDKIMLDQITLKEFIKNKKVTLSIATMNRGLTELVNSKIIARTRRQGEFFINPNFVFNGDRIVFSNAIEKKSSVKIEENNLKQIDIEDHI